MTRGGCTEVSEDKDNQVELTEISEANGNGFTIHENGNGSLQAANSRPVRPSEPAPLPPEVVITPLPPRPSDLVVNNSRFRFSVSPSSSASPCGRLRSRWILGTSAILLSLLTVGVFLGIMLHFTARDRGETNDVPLVKALIPRAETALGDVVPAFLCSVTLSHQYWEPELANVRSPRYKQLACDIEEELDRIFLVSPLKEIYNFSVVRTFRQGSIVVVFETVLIRPSHLNPDQLKGAFLEGLEYREQMILSETRDSGRELSEQKTFLALNKQKIVLIIPSTTTLHTTSLKTAFQPWDKSTGHELSWTTGRQELWPVDTFTESTRRAQLPRTTRIKPVVLTTPKQKLANIIDPFDPHSLDSFESDSANTKDIHSEKPLVGGRYPEGKTSTSRVIETLRMSDISTIVPTMTSSHYLSDDISTDVSSVSSISSISSLFVHSILASSVSSYPALESFIAEKTTELQTSSSLHGSIVTTSIYLSLPSDVSAEMHSKLNTIPSKQPEAVTTETYLKERRPGWFGDDITPAEKYKEHEVATLLDPRAATTDKHLKDRTSKWPQTGTVSTERVPKNEATFINGEVAPTVGYARPGSSTSGHKEVLTTVNDRGLESKESIDGIFNKQNSTNVDDIVNNENVKTESSIFEHNISLQPLSLPEEVSASSQPTSTAITKQMTFTDTAFRTSKTEETYDSWGAISDPREPQNLTAKYSNVDKLFPKERKRVASLNDDNMIPTEKPRYLDKLKSKVKSSDTADGRLRDGKHVPQISETKMFNGTITANFTHPNGLSLNKDDGGHRRIAPSEVSRVLEESERITDSFRLESSISVTDSYSTIESSAMTPTLHTDASESFIITNPSLHTHGISTVSSSLTSSLTKPTLEQASVESSPIETISPTVRSLITSVYVPDSSVSVTSSLPYNEGHSSSQMSNSSVQLVPSHTQSYASNISSHSTSSVSVSLTAEHASVLSSIVQDVDVTDSVYNQDILSASVTSNSSIIDAGLKESPYSKNTIYPSYAISIAVNATVLPSLSSAIISSLEVTPSRQTNITETRTFTSNEVVSSVTRITGSPLDSGSSSVDIRKEEESVALLIQPTSTSGLDSIRKLVPSSSLSVGEPVSKVPDHWSSAAVTSEVYNPCLDINIMTEFIPQCLDYFSQVPETTDTIEKCQHFLAGVICVTDYYFNYSGQQCSETEIRGFIRQHAGLFGNALPGFNPLKCIV